METGAQQRWVSHGVCFLEKIVGCKFFTDMSSEATSQGGFWASAATGGTARAGVSLPTPISFFSPL